MGVRILTDRSGTFNVSALYCSTTDVAFGPIFMESDDKTSDERAEAFLRFAGSPDVRGYSDSDLQRLYGQWLAQEAQQYDRERWKELERDERDGVLLDYERDEYIRLRLRFA